jgi:hypothetical protein
MKNLFETATVKGLKGRMAQLSPDSERVWGQMSLAQALAHCSAAMEMAMSRRNRRAYSLGGWWDAWRRSR